MAVTDREIDQRIPPSEPSRSCARNDCRRASIFYAIGALAEGDRAAELALSMMKIARQLDEMRGDSTEVS